MKNPASFLVWPLGGLILCAATARGQAPSQAGLEFFENKIRPILVNNCYKCHSSQASKLKGGLSLEYRESILKGGDNGPAIVPGDPEKSLLIKAVRYAIPICKCRPRARNFPRRKSPTW